MSAMTATRVGESMPVTADGYEQLLLELETLRLAGRRQIGERMREARADGHLADNPALYDVLVEQAQLERRIATLEEQVAAVQIVAPAPKGIAAIGTSVRVRDIALGEVAEYELVGEIEPVGNGRVSVSAPIGGALVGRRVGESVVAETPRGARSFEILSVRPLVAATPMARQAA